MCNNQETTTTSTQKGFRALYSGVPTHQNVTLLVGGKTLWPMFVSALFYALIYLLLVCNKLSSSPTPTRLFISAASGHRVSTKKHNKQANQTSASVTGAFWRHRGSDPFRNERRALVNADCVSPLSGLAPFRWQYPILTPLFISLFFYLIYFLSLSLDFLPSFWLSLKVSLHFTFSIDNCLLIAFFFISFIFLILSFCCYF